jgi:putative ABC transport system permease protein
MTRELVRMALRNISRNGRRSLLCGTMVTVGVAAILFARAYLGGLQVLIAESVVEGGFGAMQVTHVGYSKSQEMSPLHLDLPEDPTLEERLMGTENVRAVAPRLNFLGVVFGPENNAVASAIGILPQRESVVCPRGPAKASDRLRGAPLHSDDAPEVILGTALADAINVKIGDRVTLMVQTRSGSMNGVDATLVGTYRFDNAELNKRFAVVPLHLAQRLLLMKGRVTAYTIGVHDLNRLKPTLAAVRGRLAAGPWHVEVQDWGALMPYYRDVIVVQETVLGLLLIIVFGLVLIGVVNAMLMSVYERTREVGTLLSMGFSRSRIAVLFLCEAGALGTLSALLGAGIGVAITLYTHQHGIAWMAPGVGVVQNRPILATSYVALALTGAVIGALAGGLWPAWRASRLAPIEALGAH